MVLKSTTSILVAAILAISTLVGCASGPAVKYNSPADWVNQSKADNQLPLAEKADVWSEKKLIKAKLGTVGVRSKFLKQHGTTCHFDVEYSNPGTTELNESAGILAPHQNAVWAHNSASVRLKAGEAKVWELEARECPLKWGESKEMDTCASCMIRAAFVNK